MKRKEKKRRAAWRRNDLKHRQTRINQSCSSVPAPLDLRATNEHVQVAVKRRQRESAQHVNCRCAMPQEQVVGVALDDITALGVGWVFVTALAEMNDAMIRSIGIPQRLLQNTGSENYSAARQEQAAAEEMRRLTQ